MAGHSQGVMGVAAKGRLGKHGLGFILQSWGTRQATRELGLGSPSELPTPASKPLPPSHRVDSLRIQNALSKGFPGFVSQAPQNQGLEGGWHQESSSGILISGPFPAAQDMCTITAGALLPPQAGSSPRCRSLQSVPKGFRSLGGGEQHRGAATQLPAQPPCPHLLGGEGQQPGHHPEVPAGGSAGVLGSSPET